MEAKPDVSDFFTASELSTLAAADVNVLTSASLTTSQCHLAITMRLIHAVVDVPVAQTPS
jgi:hypothetical protein